MFTNGQLKELFRGIAWNINDHKTYRNFALTNSYAATACKEFSPHKKIEFTEVITILNDYNQTNNMFLILPNGFVHGNIISNEEWGILSRTQ